MDLECIKDNINIFRIGVLQLLQNFNLVHGNINTIILFSGVDFVVVRVDIDNFKRNNSILRLVETKKDENEFIFLLSE